MSHVISRANRPMMMSEQSIASVPRKRVQDRQDDHASADTAREQLHAQFLGGGGGLGANRITAQPPPPPFQRLRNSARGSQTRSLSPTKLLSRIAAHSLSR